MVQLASGSAAAQIVTLLAAPVLARLYSPEAFGLYAVFLAVAGVLIVGSTGRYEQAIVLADPEEVAGLARLAMLLAAATATVTATVAAVLLTVATPHAADDPSVWLLVLLAPAVLVGAWSSVLASRAVAAQRFEAASSASLVRGITSAGGQSLLGALAVSPGLLLGNVAGGVVSSALLQRRIRRHAKVEVSLATMRDLGGKYRRFAVVQLPSDLLNYAFVYGTTLVVGALFGLQTTGQWSMAYRLLWVPALVVGAAVSQVYYQRSVVVASLPRAAKSLFDRTLAATAALSVVPFGIIALWAEPMFTLLLGPEWTQAGEYARLALPWLWIRFVVAPVAPTALVYGRNDIQLKWTAGQISILLVMVMAALSVNLEFGDFLLWLSWGLAAGQAVVTVALRRILLRASGMQASPVDPSADDRRQA